MKVLKGTVIKDPDGIDRYEATRTIHVGEPIIASDFKPLNGAKKPVAGELMPYYLHLQLVRFSDE